MRRRRMVKTLNLLHNQDPYTIIKRKREEEIIEFLRGTKSPVQVRLLRFYLYNKVGVLKRSDSQDTRFVNVVGDSGQAIKIRTDTNKSGLIEG